ARKGATSIDIVHLLRSLECRVPYWDSNHLPAQVQTNAGYVGSSAKTILLAKSQRQCTDAAIRRSDKPTSGRYRAVSDFASSFPSADGSQPPMKDAIFRAVSKTVKEAKGVAGVWQGKSARA